jgi:hypothetical protein
MLRFSSPFVLATGACVEALLHRAEREAGLLHIEGHLGFREAPRHTREQEWAFCVQGVRLWALQWLGVGLCSGWACRVLHPYSNDNHWVQHCLTP